VCEVVFDICLASDDVTIVLSEYILAEFVRHGTGKFAAPVEKVEWAATLLRRCCVMVEPVPVPSEAFADADDLPVLGTAIAGQVDCLITGDQQLLALGEYRGVRILSPRAFYEHLRGIAK